MLAPTAAPVPAPEFPGPKGLPLQRVRFIVPVEALFAPEAPVVVPPIAIPVMVNVPVELLFTPKTVAPEQVPVMFRMPVELLKAPFAVPPVPPVQFPVMFIVPVEKLLAPCANPEVPPVQLPVMFSVPVDILRAQAPVPDPAVPPWQFPTKFAEFPDAPENVTHAVEVEPEKAFAVSVIPLDKSNEPPAVAVLALSLRTSPTVVLTFTVMEKLLECSTSALVNVPQTSLAVPVGVVAHTSVAFMFPALRAK